jgi:hypothetical protein
MKSVSIDFSDEEMAKVERCATQAQLSPAEFVKDSIARILRADYEWERWNRRAKEANVEEFKRIMAKAPDVPPIPGDELPEGWEPNKH